METILIGALLIGITLGLLGSGGSTITVPVLVYLVGHDAKLAIAESMAIVGLISLASAIPYSRSNQVDWLSVWLFGIPGMIGTLGGAWLGGLAPAWLQLVVLGAILLVASAFMMRQAFFSPARSEPKTIKTTAQTQQRIKIILEGFSVGVLTGFVGVGGGFLIVPALIVFGQLPMRVAIGTSLVIIALKSAIGFAKYQQFLVSNGLSVDGQTILIFALVGIIGSWIGQRINHRMNQRSLKQVFTVFLILVGLFIVIREGSQFLLAN